MKLDMKKVRLLVRRLRKFKGGRMVKTGFRAKIARVAVRKHLSVFSEWVVYSGGKKTTQKDYCHHIFSNACLSKSKATWEDGRLVLEYPDGLSGFVKMTFIKPGDRRRLPKM